MAVKFSFEKQGELTRFRLNNFYYDITASELSDLASCVSSALAESNSAAISRSCACITSKPVCDRERTSQGQHCYRCGHTLDCHSTQSTDQEGK